MNWLIGLLHGNFGLSLSNNMPVTELIEGRLPNSLTLAAIMGGGMATAEGGSESLARALVRLIEDHGGVIRTGSAVERTTAPLPTFTPSILR